MKSGVRTATIAGLLVVIALAAMGGTASAHAGLESSEPAAGAMLAEAPGSVTLSFSEPPDPGLSSVHVFDAAGREVGTGSITAGQAPRSLVAALMPDLANGTYTVSWNVVSEADGHASAGAFSFGVGVDPGTGAVPDDSVTETPGPSAWSVAAKIALYAGIVLAIGTAVAALWIMPGELPARRWLSGVAGTLSVIGASAMVAAEAHTLGVSLSELLSSSTGTNYRWLLGTAVALGLCSLASALTVSQEPLVLMGLAAIGVALARATGGHAAAAIPAWPQELVQAVHISAVGVWVGGFVPVLLLLRERRRSAAAPPVTEVARFSRTAGWAVLVVVLTGIIRVVDEAGGIGALGELVFDTSYGATLTVKVAFVIALIALGAVHRRRSLPRLRSDSGLLTRVLRVEAAGAVVVFGATALLTGLNPEPSPAPVPERPAAIVAHGSDFATTTRVQLTATPGMAGQNMFEARVTDYDSGDDIVATAVELTFEPVGRPEVNTSSLDLQQGGSGAWIGEGPQLSLAGVWDVTALIETRSKGTEIPLTLVTATPGSRQDEVVTADGTAIVTTTLSTGQQLQAYIDPGTAGANAVHVTAFGQDGQELPLSDLVVIVTPEGEDPRAVPAERLSPGHFSAAAVLGAGDVRVDIVASGRDGSVLQASFNHTIGA